MIFYNGKEYQDDEVIDWQIALQVNGDYFGLAQRLGLPSPPACFVFVEEHAKTEKQHLICGWYAALLHAAQVDWILTKGRRVPYF